jgi:hypothetical protein
MNKTGIRFNPYQVKSNAVLYHVYTEKYGPTTFNGSGRGLRRFDPIFKPDGSVIASYYAAFSDLVALNETVIRFNDSNCPELSWRPETSQEVSDGLTTSLCQVIVKRSLQLIDLQSLEDPQGNNPIETMLHSDETAYPKLHTIAEYLAHNFEQYDGLIWDSYQRGTPGERAVLLFGHKVKTADLHISAHDALNSAGNLDRLRDAIRATGCVVPEWLLR